MKKFILSFAFLLAFVLPTYSEWTYELAWGRKHYEPQFNSQAFRGPILHPNDSTILTLSWDAGTVYRNSIYKLYAYTGEIIRYYPNEDSIAHLEYSKDGSYLSVSGNNFLGFVDTANLEYTNKISFPEIANHHYNEDKGILTGYTNNSVKLFNAQSKELIKEYPSSYFKPKDLTITKVALSNVENKLIYSYEYTTFTPPTTYVYYRGIRIINSDGKILLENELQNISGNKNLWSLSHDGTKIVYFNQNEKMKVLDLTTMKTIYEGDVKATTLTFSNDDKLIYIAGQGLKILNLTTLKIFIAYSFGSFQRFQLNYYNDDYIYIYIIAVILINLKQMLQQEY